MARLTGEQQAKQHLISEARIGPGTRLLDAACGSGTLLRLAMQQAGKCKHFHGQLIGFDIDQRILEQAAGKLTPAGTPNDSSTTVQLVKGTVTALPFANHSFDVVLCSLLMHHLLPAEKRAALAELRRVLTDGGVLILADYSNPSSFWSRLKFLPVQIADGWNVTQLHNADIFPGLLQQLGFAAVRESLQLETPLGTLRCFIARK